jgi:hypothetical protein
VLDSVAAALVAAVFTAALAFLLLWADQGLEGWLLGPQPGLGQRTSIYLYALHDYESLTYLASIKMLDSIKMHF